MADNKILDELKKATQQVQQIAKMEEEERTKYKDEVAKQFFELQKTVHSIINEEGIILKNFRWEWIARERSKLLFNSFINCKAELLATEYGFSKQSFLNLLKVKNEGAFSYEEFGTAISYYMLVPKE